MLGIHHNVILVELGIGNEQNIGERWTGGWVGEGEIGRKAMTLEIYKPRTERNSKQLNKTLVEMVRCSPALGSNNTLANKTQYIFTKKKIQI